MNALSPLTREVFQVAKGLKNACKALLYPMDGPPRIESKIVDERKGVEDFIVTYPEEWSGFGVETLLQQISGELDKRLDELVVQFEKQIMCVFDNLNDPTRLPSTGLSSIPPLSSSSLGGGGGTTTTARRNEALAQILPKGNTKRRMLRSGVPKGPQTNLTTDMLSASLYILLESTAQRLNAERAYILLHSEKSERSYLRMAAHYPTTEMKLQFPTGSGVCGAVFTSGVALNVANTHGNPWFITENEKNAGYNVNSLLAFPIFQADGPTTHNNQTVGIINVINAKNTGGFTTDDETAVLHTSALLSRIMNNYPVSVFIQHTFDPASTLNLLKMPYSTSEFQTTALSEISQSLGDAAVLTNVSHFRPHQLIYRTVNKGEFVTPSNFKAAGQPVKFRDGANLKDLHTYTFNLERMWRSGLEDSMSLQSELDEWKNKVVDLSLEVRGLRRLLGVAIRCSSVQKLKDIFMRDPLTRDDTLRYHKKVDAEKIQDHSGFVPSLNLHHRRSSSQMSDHSGSVSGQRHIPQPPTAVANQSHFDKQQLYNRGRYIFSKGTNELFEHGLAKMAKFVSDLPNVTTEPLVTQHHMRSRSPPLNAVLGPPSTPQQQKLHQPSPPPKDLLEPLVNDEAPVVPSDAMGNNTVPNSKNKQPILEADDVD